MEDEGVDMYKDFFMLFDECEKIIQDNDFRETIEAPLDDFFSFPADGICQCHADPAPAIRGLRNMVSPNCASSRLIRIVSRSVWSRLIMWWKRWRKYCPNVRVKFASSSIPSIRSNRFIRIWGSCKTLLLFVVPRALRS